MEQLKEKLEVLISFIETDVKNIKVHEDSFEYNELEYIVYTIDEFDDRVLDILEIEVETIEDEVYRLLKNNYLNDFVDVEINKYSLKLHILDNFDEYTDNKVYETYNNFVIEYEP